jgi:hypothetical protein
LQILTGSLCHLAHGSTNPAWISDEVQMKINKRKVVDFTENISADIGGILSSLTK